MSGDEVKVEEEVKVDSGLVLSRKVFLLRQEELPGIDKLQIKKEVVELLTSQERTPLYVKYCDEFGWMADEDLVEKMTAKNAEELKQIEDKIKDAEENLGDSEVREALLAKAEFLARIGKKEEALTALKVTEEKTVAIGQKMDLMFTQLRHSLMYSDYSAVKRDLAKAKLMFEQGGDWERKNRLKVYEGLFCMAARDFKRAAELFLDSIATFSTYELFDYPQFVLYTVITAMVALDRVQLKAKVVDAPEILQVIHQIPHLAQFLNSLYSCHYLEFFQAFCHISDVVRADLYLHRHFRYFMRQVRVVAYTQFLESYKSVKLDSMATAFGVSPAFLDTELSSFISGGRLNCKIDKVSGIIETNRPDAKNALYQQVIKQGDLLLNRVQKLSKVIDL